MSIAATPARAMDNGAIDRYVEGHGDAAAPRAGHGHNLCAKVRNEGSDSATRAKQRRLTLEQAIGVNDIGQR